MPDWVTIIASILINISAVIGVFLAIFALISVLERKILGRMQNRYGPNRVGPFGLFQPVADGIKMLIKEDVVPARADKVVHFLAPILVAATAILTLGIIPYGRNMTPFAIDGGILFFFAVGSTTELAVFMAGWGSNNKFSMLGAMRAIAQMVSYELPLILTTLPVVMVTGALSPDAIVAAQDGYSFGIVPHWFVTTPWGAAAFILFFVSGLVESNRTPFDVPEGESEIVAGHMLLSFLGIYFFRGTFDFAALAELGKTGDVLPGNLKWLAFAGIFLGLAVKVPLFPFHTWLPDAYEAAPTGVSMVLTGTLSKMGVYGFLRLLLPLFPNEIATLGP